MIWSAPVLGRIVRAGTPALHQGNMQTLNRDLRKQLENTVIAARRTAEKGAEKALRQLTVGDRDVGSYLSNEQRNLRNRLHAHGRQPGDRQDARGGQARKRLKEECAYEHWHRMLFARFLAESDLLIEPESGMPITLDECRELARGQGADWLGVASDFAVRMLPQIFRPGDPVLEVTLPPETRHELEALLKSLPRDVFLADDSLGWVYQFWQDEEKDRINKSEVKIGADELPAVTQLFTEDYMVLFLLHNTLGAWWAGKVIEQRPELATTVASEDELRAACSVGGIEWTYLRFVREGDGPWRPAAGTFDGWPRAAKEITVLDPCMGSGHFLVFALPILVALRMEEEGLSREQAVDVVLRENLFGLEIDPRCTQIAAFNLALTAWRMVGHRRLPPLNLACSGLGINAKEADWVKLAGDDSRLHDAMQQLYTLFKQAPILGSLIDPRRAAGDLFTAEFGRVGPLLDRALLLEQADENAHELAVTARGVVHAVRLLTSTFSLVTTNVPYLGYKRQEAALKSFCESDHAKAKWDLALCMLERCIGLSGPGCTAALVTPQSWLFQVKHGVFRKALLTHETIRLMARLGPGAFETISGEVVNIVLAIINRRTPTSSSTFRLLDATAQADTADKSRLLKSEDLSIQGQLQQLQKPGARIAVGTVPTGALLSRYVENPQGIKSGDDPRWLHAFGEFGVIQTSGWNWCQTAAEQTEEFQGLTLVVDWRAFGEGMVRPRKDCIALHHRGVAVNQTSTLYSSLYFGERFDSTLTPLIPRDEKHLAAVWSFCSSPTFRSAVRQSNPTLFNTNSALLQVEFDLAYWGIVAAEKYPNGLPRPHSHDPTQWLFNGHPKGSDQPLQVAVARLLGYRWPRQTGSSFLDCPALGPDGLEAHVDDDGIVCLTSIKGEAPAADRLRALLADAFSSDWSPAKQAELLAQAGYGGKTLEAWLRDSFFEQHCAAFHQRPFIWHVWDGRNDGFHALVNYHKLAAPNGEGRRTIEKLIYTYLGDWIDRQRADQKSGVEGADGRLATAQHLQRELEKILEGEKPYDIFVRWKPLREQPIGWEPDINDGVRVNTRPFMTARPLGARAKNACILRVTPKIKWEKDRGKEPRRAKEDYPWFWTWEPTDKPDFAGGPKFDGNRWNDLHYSLDFKRKARDRHAARAQEQRA